MVPLILTDGIGEDGKVFQNVWNLADQYNIGPEQF